MTPTENEIRATAPDLTEKSGAGRMAPIPPHPENLALFLDIDGTLLEIVETPDRVNVPPALPRCLERLAECLDGALALITGRTLDDADALFAGLSLPVGAVHGLERRSFQGEIERTGSGSDLADLKEELIRFAAKHPGVMLEDKKRTLALHYRAAPELEAVAKAFIRDRVDERAGIAVLHGKMVIEIKPEGVDKGGAIRSFMDEAPFKGRVPVFFGDDTTDEFGFAAVRALGGYGFFVGGDRETGAQFRLPDVAAVHDWLDRLLCALEGQG
jgi:trehalose 6-phosphate phosphatase